MPRGVGVPGTSVVPTYSIKPSAAGEISAPAALALTNAAAVSDSIFADYIVPFEAVSVLLLAALIGAVVVARKE